MLRWGTAAAGGVGLLPRQCEGLDAIWAVIGRVVDPGADGVHQHLVGRMRAQEPLLPLHLLDGRVRRCIA